MGHFSDSASPRPRSRRSEVRTRSGCWKCRERRVKCPEQRPVCRHCERLGLKCGYDIRLSWQAIAVPDNGNLAGPEPEGSQVLTGDWMFINAYNDDFGNRQWTTSAAPETSLIRSRPIPLPSANSDVDHDQAIQLLSPLHVLSPSPLAVRHMDVALWEYFDQFIAPQCALDSSANPYRHIILRVAASSPGGPLFHCVLAAAANQLHNLGCLGYEQRMWQHRATALRLLREELESSQADMERGLSSSRTVTQVVGSSIMLCFFEILRDCSESWTIHTEFASSYLRQYQQQSQHLDTDVQKLIHFSTAYSSSHSILAATASAKSFGPALILDDPSFQTLTGCSHQLLSLISQTSQLAHDQISPGPATLADLAARRDDIERQLTDLYQPIPQADNTVESDTVKEDAELALVAETKRLTALLYLYSRIDHAGPHEPHIVRLTARILSLIQRVSLRTNTILWPLFMVGTLGVRPEDDEHRKLVLERLTALQETRQLGNVKKARQMLEEVWKARDLRREDAGRAWAVLEGRGGTISLA